MERLTNAPIPDKYIVGRPIVEPTSAGTGDGTGFKLGTRLARKKEACPLRLVPLPGERKLSLELIHTAAHELNHALTAFALGVDVISISVKPQGNSLGRTIFSGLVSPETFKIIAAAGAVDTPYGTASGYGMDMFMIERINYIRELIGQSFGMSKDEARAKAGGLLTTISPEVLIQAAEILACLEEVPGSALLDILARARWEIEWKKENQGKLLPDTLVGVETIEDRPKQYTLIESLEGETYKLTRYDQGQAIGQYHICGKCGGIDKHRLDCKMLNTNEENSDLTIRSPEELTKRKIDDFKPSGVIFEDTG